MSAAVGNDLIDLRAAHNLGRGEQPRFLQRVLTGREREQLAAQARRDFGFALLWSAKEAAYKAARKRMPTLVFAPRRWQVEVDSLQPGESERIGSVQLDACTQVPVRWQPAAQWLHCIAVLGTPSMRIAHAVAALEACAWTDGCSARERAGFSRPESGAVRVLAKGLLRREGITGVEILREGEGSARLPPRACIDGVALAGVDLSLSHDGAHVAAVVGIHRG